MSEVIPPGTRVVALRRIASADGTRGFEAGEVLEVVGFEAEYKPRSLYCLGRPRALDEGLWVSRDAFKIYSIQWAQRTTCADCGADIELESLLSNTPAFGSHRWLARAADADVYSCGESDTAAHGPDWSDLEWLSAWLAEPASW